MELTGGQFLAKESDFKTKLSHSDDKLVLVAARLKLNWANRKLWMFFKSSGQKTISILVS